MGFSPEVLSVRDLRPPARSTRPNPPSAALAGHSAEPREAKPASDRQGRSDQPQSAAAFAPERRIARRFAASQHNTIGRNTPAVTTQAESGNASRASSAPSTSVGEGVKPSGDPVPLSPESSAVLLAQFVTTLRDTIGDEPVSRYFNEGNAFTIASDGSLTVHLPSDFQARRAKRYDADLRKAVALALNAGEADCAKAAVNYHISLHNTPAPRAHTPHSVVTNVEPKPAHTKSANSNGVHTHGDDVQPTTQLSAPARRRRFHPANTGKDASDQLIADDRYALERFITGPSNQIAYRAAVYVASGLGAATEYTNTHPDTDNSTNNTQQQHRHIRTPAFVAPDRVGHLFLHGSCGTGKTHLLLGIARRFKQCNPSAAVRYITGPAFADAYIHAVRSRTVPAFRRAYRNVGLLCIDDVHFLADKDGTQTELLHTFDELDLGGATVILASDDHPKRIERFRSALVSRFVSGLVLEVQKPDRDLFKRILDESCKRTGLRLEASASARLLDELEPGTSSVRDLEGLVLKVNAMTTVLGVRSGIVGLSIVEQAIRGGRESCSRPGAASRKPIRLDALVTEICAYLNVELDDLKGSGRHKRVVLARSMAAFLGRAMTSASFPELARAMNRKSHSAVIAARDRFHEQLERDAPAPPLDEHIQQLGARTLRDLVALTRSHVERHAR